MCFFSYHHSFSQAFIYLFLFRGHPDIKLLKAQWCFDLRVLLLVLGLSELLCLLFLQLLFSHNLLSSQIPSRTPQKGWRGGALKPTSGHMVLKVGRGRRVWSSTNSASPDLLVPSFSAFSTVSGFASHS